MEYRVLGPLEVLAGDRVVPIGGGRRLSLLALLFINANEVVSAERLIDQLWGESPPATAAKSLQVRVSELRRALGGAAAPLLTRGSGYLLRMADDELDSRRFEVGLGDGQRRLGAGDARGAAAEGVVVSVMVVPPAHLPPARRRFVASFEQAIRDRRHVCRHHGPGHRDPPQGDHGIRRDTLLRHPEPAADAGQGWHPRQLRDRRKRRHNRRRGDDVSDREGQAARRRRDHAAQEAAIGRGLVTTGESSSSYRRARGARR